MGKVIVTVLLILLAVSLTLVVINTLGPPTVNMSHEGAEKINSMFGN